MADPQRGLLVSLLVLVVAAIRGGGAIPPPPPLAAAAAAVEDPKEPSCDQLRAMWRFSKRQSRAAQMSNEIPTYRDPFAYPLWDPRPSNNGLPVPAQNSPRMGSFRNGRRFVYATQMRQSPRYPTDAARNRNSALRELTNIIKMERARELQQQRLAEQVSSSRTRIYKKPSVTNYGQVVDGPVSALDLVRLEGMSKDPAMSSMSMGNGDVVKRDPESVDYISDSVDLRAPQQERRASRNV